MVASLLSFGPRLVINSHHRKNGKWSIDEESIGSVTFSGAIHILPTEVVNGTVEVSTGDDVMLHLGQNPFATSYYKNAFLGRAIVSIQGVLHVGAPGYAVNLESEAGAIFTITE